MAIDTLSLAKRLREAGFDEPQAEAVIATMQAGAAAADLATKSDLADLRAATGRDIADLRAATGRDIADLRAATGRDIADLRAATEREFADVRAEMREQELRIEAKLEALKADILGRVFAMILGALIVNIVAIFGAMFGVAKLLGH